MNKKIIAILAVFALFATAGTAALLEYYGTITATANVQQSVILLETEPDVIWEDAPGGERFCFKHHIENRASVPAEVMLLASYDPDGEGITTTYTSEVTDNTANPIADFGARHNEVCGIIPADLTLDEIFEGDGFNYDYTVVNGGTYGGASPIVAILDLADGRHVVLFPGWGARTGGQSLQYSDTVSSATADAGPVVVDFVVYDADYVNRWSSLPSYPGFDGVKAISGTPVDGTEVVVGVSFQHQAANTGETDRLDIVSYPGEHNEFSQVIEGTPFVIASDEVASLCACYEFAINIAPANYTITTDILPVVS